MKSPMMQALEETLEQSDAVIGDDTCVVPMKKKAFQWVVPKVQRDEISGTLYLITHRYILPAIHVSPRIRRDYTHPGFL